MWPYIKINKIEFGNFGYGYGIFFIYTTPSEKNTDLFCFLNVLFVVYII